MKFTGSNTNLLAVGLAGIIFWSASAGVEWFNGPAPSLDTLQELSGQLLKVEVTHDKSTTFANLTVEQDKRKAILAQQDMGQFVDTLGQLRPGGTVSALVSNKLNTNYGLGIPHYRMWQLLVDGTPVFYYDDLMSIRNRRIGSDRKFRLIPGVAGLLCIAVLIFRKVKARFSN